MIRVTAHPQGATAYQFLEETAAGLDRLQLPTGPVTVQMPDSINRIPGRCYVPTVWGAAVLELGDWFVVFDVGVVAAYPAEQFSLLFAQAVEEPVEPPEMLEEETPEGAARVSLLASEPSIPESYLGKYVMQTPNSGESIKESLSRVSSRMEDEALPKAVAVPVLRFMAGIAQHTQEINIHEYFDRYRLDYSFETLTEGTVDAFRFVVNATGREVVRFRRGEVVVGYPDGTVEVEQA